MTVGLEVGVYSSSGRTSMQNSKTSRHVKVVGADWCPVKQQNQGKELKPTIVIGDRILAEPTNQELDAALGL
jgi:hypothetical protein